MTEDKIKNSHASGIIGKVEKVTARPKFDKSKLFKKESRKVELHSDNF